MKTVEREQARKMRRERGSSVKELAALLGVAKSTVSVWVRDIELVQHIYGAIQEYAEFEREEWVM